jgi:hypothetical protein
MVLEGKGFEKLGFMNWIPCNWPPARDMLGQAREQHSGICPVRLRSGLKSCATKRSKTFKNLQKLYGNIQKLHRNPSKTQGKLYKNCMEIFNKSIETDKN